MKCIRERRIIMHKMVSTLAVFAAIPLIWTSALAQSISGKVVDSQAKPVPGAKVVIQNSQGANIATGFTNSEGAFVVKNVPQNVSGYKVNISSGDKVKQFPIGAVKGNIQFSAPIQITP
jgi:Carboxypeptidase regulatory-like domain